MTSLYEQVRQTLHAINVAWRSGRPEDIRVHLHPNVTMALPGFVGTITGQNALVESFVEFRSTSTILEYSETDEQFQVCGACAVATYHFDMLYRAGGYVSRATGRDLWVFEYSNTHWLAVWRTMLDVFDRREPSRESDAL